MGFPRRKKQQQEHNQDKNESSHSGQAESVNIHLSSSSLLTSSPVFVHPILSSARWPVLQMKMMTNEATRETSECFGCTPPTLPTGDSNTENFLPPRALSSQTTSIHSSWSWAHNIHFCQNCRGAYSTALVMFTVRSRAFAIPSVHHAVVSSQ